MYGDVKSVVKLNTLQSAYIKFLCIQLCTYSWIKCNKQEIIASYSTLTSNLKHSTEEFSFNICCEFHITEHFPFLSSFDSTAALAASSNTVFTPFKHKGIL